MLIAKVLWKVSGDCNAKKPAPMKTMQKGPIDTSKTNSAVLKKEVREMTNQEKGSDAYQLERDPLVKAENQRKLLKELHVLVYGE